MSADALSSLEEAGRTGEPTWRVGSRSLSAGWNYAVSRVGGQAQDNGYSRALNATTLAS
jgi:hypothetical protein